MVGRLSFCLALLIIFQQCCIQICARSFDYYYFVQQWPGSFCDTQKGCCYAAEPPTDFGIHGLWPQLQSGKWPEYCNENDLFQASKVGGLIDKMDTYWGSLSCSSNNNDFWKHEWEKHGTCSTFDETTYFAKGLALREKVDLLGALKSAGIVPDGGAYGVSDIKSAIKGGLGYEVVLNCNKSSEGEEQLFEVYVCVSRNDASTLIDCPADSSESCSSEVVFPALQ